MKAVAEMMEQAVPSFQGYSGQPDWLITDMSSRPVETARTVLFSSCFGLVEKNVLDTTVKILRRIDPDIKVLGGYDFCCGELHYIAGRPQEAQVQFSRLIQALEAFSPEKVVIFCPTCNMNFDERHRIRAGHAYSSWTISPISFQDWGRSTGSMQPLPFTTRAISCVEAVPDQTPRGKS